MADGVKVTTDAGPEVLDIDIHGTAIRYLLG